MWVSMYSKCYLTNELIQNEIEQKERHREWGGSGIERVKARGNEWKLRQIKGNKVQ